LAICQQNFKKIFLIIFFITNQSGETGFDFILFTDERAHCLFLFCSCCFTN